MKKYPHHKPKQIPLLHNSQMPNNKGGKGYKKGKHPTGEVDVKMIQWDEDDGQMFGRVLKSVGNRRFRVYCNDNKERLCKLAGAIRKSEWVGEGTIVVISLRGLSSGSAAGGNAEDLGDILQVVDPRLHGKIKKLANVNPALFAQVESQDIQQVIQRVNQGSNLEDEDDLFDRSDAKEETNVKKDDDSDIDIDGI
jgi:initiation factor 1A